MLQFVKIWHDEELCENGHGDDKIGSSDVMTNEEGSESEVGFQRVDEFIPGSTLSYFDPACDL